MLGNPKFLVVLALEVVLGCTGKLISELNVREDRFWKACSLEALVPQSWRQSCAYLMPQNVPWSGLPIASALALDVIAHVSCMWLLSPRLHILQTPTTCHAACWVPVLCRALHSMQELKMALEIIAPVSCKWLPSLESSMRQRSQPGTAFRACSTQHPPRAGVQPGGQ